MLGHPPSACNLATGSSINWRHDLATSSSRSSLTGPDFFFEPRKDIERLADQRTQVDALAPQWPVPARRAEALGVPRARWRKCVDLSKWSRQVPTRSKGSALDRSQSLWPGRDGHVQARPRARRPVPQVSPGFYRGLRAFARCSFRKAPGFRRAFGPA